MIIRKKNEIVTGLNKSLPAFVHFTNGIININNSKTVIKNSIKYNNLLNKVLIYKHTCKNYFLFNKSSNGFTLNRVVIVK